MGVHEVVGAGDVDAFALFQNLLFNFLGDIHVVVLVPLFVLVVVEVTVVVAAVG